MKKYKSSQNIIKNRFLTIFQHQLAKKKEKPEFILLLIVLKEEYQHQ